MRKILSIIRFGLLFVNYIICILASSNTYILKDISVGVLIGTGVLLMGISVVILRRYININVMYNIIYAVLALILVLDKNNKLSDVSMFTFLITVVLVAIFCWYLHLYESKVQRITSKGGDAGEIEDAYKKQVGYLLLVLASAWVLLVVIYYALWGVSAKVITYLYSINAIFSIPAMIGFLLVMLISIFVFVVYMLV